MYLDLKKQRNQKRVKTATKKTHYFSKRQILPQSLAPIPNTLSKMVTVI